MQLNKRRNTHKVIICVIATLATGWALFAQASDNASVIVPITASVKAGTCTLGVPDQVLLGSITPGTKQYNPFNVEITCLTATNTELYAQVVSGNLTAGTTDRVNMAGPVNTGTAAQLWLTSPEGKVITLDGSGSTDSTKGFCSDAVSRTCTLTPSTLVDITTPRGQTIATIKFNIRYP